MSVKIFGIRENQTLIEQRLNQIQGNVANAIRVTALAVEGDAIKSIQRGTKTGRAYPRGEKTHIASAPGEAPATDTGELVASIKNVTEITPEFARVGSDKDYGAYLEFGTMKIKERPWLRPARLKGLALFKQRLKRL